MASSQKIVTALCICVMLASFGVIVEGGSGGGMFGGKGKKGGQEILETLLVAGLLAKILEAKNGLRGRSQARTPHAAPGISAAQGRFAAPQIYGAPEMPAAQAGFAAPQIYTPQMYAAAQARFAAPQILTPDMYAAQARFAAAQVFGAPEMYASQASYSVPQIFDMPEACGIGFGQGL